MTALKEPSIEQVLDFCSTEPVERVFLDEAARRGLGRMLATMEDGHVTALCPRGRAAVRSPSRRPARAPG